MAIRDPSTPFVVPHGDRPAGARFASRSPVLGANGMAATSQPLATIVAVDLLRAGGTAVDAAIGANAVLGLVEPTGCGVGGDLFAVVWEPGDEKLHGLNASGRSPQNLSLEQLRAELNGGAAVPERGALPVTVPGAVDGWFELHDRFGRLPMEEVLAPAIRYAREGFAVTQVIAHEWKASADAFEKSPELGSRLESFRKTFLLDGRSPCEGEVFRNPDLARTYETIGAGGRDAFYRGAVATTIDAYMQRVGGFLRGDDLAAHQSTWAEPVSTTYRGYDVYELPPNGQGIAALQMLNILEGFDLAAMGHNSTDYLHVHTEAKKLAFEDRARLYADPDFFRAPVDRLISKEYADRRRSLIRMDDIIKDVDCGLKSGDTVYLTTADSSGMMVSLIQSNYMGMGSGLVPAGLGFGLQNRGRLFALDDEHPNAYAAGKRPFHTIIPALVMKDGRPYMSFGVMGGHMQPQGHVQILCNMIDFGMDLQAAGDAARYRHSGSSQPTGERMSGGGRLHLESGIAPSAVEGLRRRGHAVESTTGGFGGYQAIVADHENGVYHGASEMRKDGQAIGY